jgi:hypothetical protein
MTIEDLPAPFLQTMISATTVFLSSQTKKEIGSDQAFKTRRAEL